MPMGEQEKDLVSVPCQVVRVITETGATCVYLQALPNNCYYLSLSLQRGSRRAVVAPLSLGHAMLNRAKTESRGGVKWASLIAGEVGGGYHFST